MIRVIRVIGDRNVLELVGLSPLYSARPFAERRLIHTFQSPGVGGRLLLGAAGAVALSQVIANELYGVGALDPGVICLVGLAMAALAAMASTIPERIDPAPELSE